ncbi:chemotaxis protein CheW [Komagataeibacter rhaeticus]|nr:chemotaxis protein CheW [Komagataeibacter rhaeticus]
MTGERAAADARDAFARRVLHERARALASRAPAGRQAVPRRPLIMVDVADQPCGVDLHAVLRVTDPVWNDMPRRPDCPPGVQGCMAIRATCTPCSTCRCCWEGAAGKTGVMLLLRSVSSIPLGRIALLATSAAGAVEITGTPIALTPSGLPQASLPDGRRLTVIDPARLFSSRYVGV